MAIYYLINQEHYDTIYKIRDTKYISPMTKPEIQEKTNVLNQKKQKLKRPRRKSFKI